MRCAIALLVLMSVAALPSHAAGLHRCIDANGGAIFTDQACEDIGASVRPEPVPVSGAASTGRLHARTCARTTEGLLRGLRAALAAGDVNQVAAFYHWPGITTVGSNDILDRLQAIAARPLVSAELVRERTPQDADGFQTVASGQPPEASAIELVQARSGADATPTRTVFALTEYMGCWWVHF
jgi:hypothetical protein